MLDFLKSVPALISEYLVLFIVGIVLHLALTAIVTLVVIRKGHKKLFWIWTIAAFICSPITLIVALAIPNETLYEHKATDAEGRNVKFLVRKNSVLLTAAILATAHVVVMLGFFVVCLAVPSFSIDNPLVGQICGVDAEFVCDMVAFRDDTVSRSSVAMSADDSLTIVQSKVNSLKKRTEENMEEESGKYFAPVVEAVYDEAVVTQILAENADKVAAGLKIRGNYSRDVAGIIVRDSMFRVLYWVNIVSFAAGAVFCWIAYFKKKAWAAMVGAICLLDISFAFSVMPLFLFAILGFAEQLTIDEDTLVVEEEPEQLAALNVEA